MQQRNSYLIGKAFKNYLAASVLTVAATQVAGIVDASIVGNLIGADALAAVNLSKPLLQAFFAVSICYISSTTMMAGIAIGKGDKTKANKLFTFSLIVSLVLGALFILSGLLTFNPLSQLLCSSDNLRTQTNDYMFVTILSVVPQLLMYAFHQYVTVDGSPKLVTRAVIVGNLFNVLCDILFIKYFGWGIAGAAWATFIMYIVCVVMVLPHFRKRGTLRLCMPHCGDIDYVQIMTYGLPLFFSTILLSVQFVGNNYVAGTYLGDNGLIALAVCMQLLSFSMIILTGTLRTIQPVGSILRGLDDERGMKFLMFKAYKFQCVCLPVLAAAMVFFPRQLGALLGAGDEASMQVVAEALPIFSLNVVMQALLYNLIPIYQFYNRKRLTLILSFGQTLLPMVGFWLLEGGWIGFFLGQAAVALAVLVGNIMVMRKDKSLLPLFLIPKGNDKEVYDVTIETTIEALGKCRRELSQFLQSHKIDSVTVGRCVLCAEELIQNIIQHGHAHCVDLRATERVISIHDDGKPFNPLEYKAEGEGLGLKIVHSSQMDICYDFRFNQNMITIRIEGSSPALGDK